MDFVQVERAVTQLRQDVAAGHLTERQFKAQLREMMVQDEQGTWWMVGYETNTWYRHDGTDWVSDSPPARVAQEKAEPQAHSAPVALPRPSRTSWGITALLVGMTLTVIATVGAYYWANDHYTSLLKPDDRLEAYSYHQQVTILTIAEVWASAAWLAGLIPTVIIAARAWRPKPSRLYGVAVSLAYMALTAAAGLLVGGLTYLGLITVAQSSGPPAWPAKWVAAGAIWLVGVVLTLDIARQVWHLRAGQTRAIILLIFGPVVSYLLAGSAAALGLEATDSDTGMIIALVGGGVLFLGGLALSITLARKYWRG